MTSVPPPFPPPARPPLPAGGPAPPDELPNWPAWAPFAAMLITLGVAILGVSIVALGASLAGVDVNAGDPPPGVTIAGTFIQDGALIFSALLLARLTAGRPRLAQLGLRPVGWSTAAGWLLAAWVCFFVFSFIWAAALGITENDDLPQELGADDSTLALIAVAVLVCVMAPIAEELFFRGFCFTALRRWIGLIPGAIATGVIFGLIHAGSADPEFLAPLAFFGMVLCFLYYKTESLLPCMALHALNNSLALGISQDWSFAGVVALMVAATATVVGLSLATVRAAHA